jgi:hypothetical protein
MVIATTVTTAATPLRRLLTSGAQPRPQHRHLGYGTNETRVAAEGAAGRRDQVLAEVVLLGAG